jgi:outer membrane protein W
MKKIIFAAAALFVFGFANAQDKKEATGGKGYANGDVYVTGAVSIGSSKEGDVKETTFEINPMVGFFVTDNIAIGGQIGYASDKIDNDGTTTLDESTLSIGVFGRYYATPASDFSVFGQLGLNYFTTDHGDADFKTNGFDVALRPGINYFLSDHFAIEATFGRLGFTSEKDDTDGAENQTNFGLELDMRSIGFGMTYKF